MRKLMFLNSKVGGSPLSLLGGFTHFGSQDNNPRVLLVIHVSIDTGDYAS